MILHRLGRLGLSLVLTLGGLVALSSGPAEAQSREAACRQVLTSPRLPADDTDGFLRVQRVLAIALDRPTPRLSDRRRGPTSEAALVDLCLAVPFPDRVDVVDETWRLILEYSRLLDQVPDWGARLWDPALVDRLARGSDPGLAVRLAGSPAMTAAVLSPDGAPATCGPGPFSDEVRAGLAALAAADPRVGGVADPFAQACVFYPTRAVTGALEETLVRFGTLETARPGAIAALISPEFARWLAEDAQPRLRRLVGSTPAVQRLIEDFLATRPAPAPTPTPVAMDGPASCNVDPRALRYWAFGEGEATLLAGGRDIGPDLRALGELRDTDTALMQDILGVLGDEPSACLNDRIEALLSRSDSPARVYRLNEAGVAGLAFVAEFGDSQATVEALVGRLAPSREALLDGTRAAIRRSLQERYDADIERAAEIFAAAAEPLPPTVDLPAVGMPEPDPVELPETFIVTEITDATLQASIENQDFVDALLGTQFSPAISREVLMGEVRRVLRPLAAAEIDRIVNADTERVAELVEERWTMTPALAHAILAIPEIAQQGHDLPDAARNELLGVSYPRERLMQSAFAAVSPTLPDALQTRALALSERIVPDPEAVRLSGSIAEPGCGCVLRREENALVYAFYPFWLAPTAPGPAAADAAGAEDGREAERPELPRVDFELVERIAFYGLHWTDESGVLDLRFRRQWLAMRRDFVTSAHRHRSRADLAIRITGWETWTEPEIRTFVEDTDEMMAPFQRFDRLSLEEAARFLPTLFDRPQPDALTLIVDGYDGIGTNTDADRLVAIVERIARPLAARGQTVNLAFDTDLSERARSVPMLSDIRALLEKDAGEEAATLDNILVFLERPTAKTAAEIVFRMEAAPFSTAVRTDIMRRILPVVPPGGHRFVPVDPAPAAQATSDDYAQLSEDLAYFQYSFGGMGFWPAPLVGNPDHKDVADIVFDTWDKWVFGKGRLKNFELAYDEVCSWICPNRFYYTAAAMILGLMLAGLIWRSFYRGWADKVAFRWGVVWAGSFILLLLLAGLSSCDRIKFAIWPPIFLALLVVTLIGILVFNTYQRARNGPPP